MTKKFKVTVGSDNIHKDLAAEIIYGNQFIAELTQEGGFENLMIELFHPSNKDTPFFKCQLEDFLSTINKAKQKLWELRKIE